jgi:RNA polymerase sigma factor (sigma-70 family)
VASVGLDALQDTMLAAWRGLEGFDGRASVRTWLYRIATNRCLDALRSARRGPAKQWDYPGIEPPEPTALGEIHWLEPYPDALLDGAISVPLGPEARYEQTVNRSRAHSRTPSSHATDDRQHCPDLRSRHIRPISRRRPPSFTGAGDLYR